MKPLRDDIEKDPKQLHFSIQASKNQLKENLFLYNTTVKDVMK